tara:strand:- start:6115 stop:7110 length:996 start_codon:yes stop_codon:yes gene_type:complete
MKTGKEISITTPDYPPNRLGGLATFSKTLVESLEHAGVKVNLTVWNKAHQVKSLDQTLTVNIHSWPILYNSHQQCRDSVNFIHAAELLPYSKNILKRIVKKIIHARFLKRLQLAKRNIFISQYALDLACKYGYHSDVTRDIIFHNRINLKGAEFINKTLNDDELTLCCFARDVPHKNILGTIKFAEDLATITNKKVTLYCGNTKHSSSKIDLRSRSYSDEEREDIYKQSHLNLIFSLDHSKIGNIEGFGLTPLEAAKYGVPSLGLGNGGLPESIHHNFTGLILRDLNKNEIESTWNKLVKDYEQISRNAFDHVMSNHSHHDYAKLILELMK